MQQRQNVLSIVRTDDSMIGLRHMRAAAVGHVERSGLQ